MTTGDILRGLEIERACVAKDCDRDCGACELVQDRDWLLSMFDSAIEEIKRHEPRVMKVSEITETQEPVWLEMMGVKAFPVLFKRATSTALIFTARDGYERIVCTADTTWRCWTGRPSEEVVRRRWTGGGVG